MGGLVNVVVGEPEEELGHGEVEDVVLGLGPFDELFQTLDLMLLQEPGSAKGKGVWSTVFLKDKGKANSLSNPINNLPRNIC